MAGRNFKKFPTFINILPKQDYNGSFGKNTFRKGNFGRQMASKVLLGIIFLFRWNLYYLNPFTVKYAGKIIARPISRRKHIWRILNILLDGITHLKKEQETVY